MAQDGAPPKMIALDWGTTSCRAYLLGDGGRVLGTRTNDRGVMSVPHFVSGSERSAAFENELRSICGDWIDGAPDAPLLACGMIGSNQGWIEAEYRRLPADLRGASECLVSVPASGRQLWIVPGLLSDSPASIRLPDVMRGEETQLLGALPPEPSSDADRLVILPGTHTKWVRMRGSTVMGFGTAMTGELYGLLTRHSILSRLAEPGGPPDDESFAFGLDVAFDSDDVAFGVAGTDIWGTLFSARTLVISGELRPTGVHDYLSGLLIGAEVAGFTRRLGTAGGDLASDTAVTLCANPALTPRYARALQRAGITADRADADAAALGLWRTAVSAQLIGKGSP